jgi:uronate dehydrogenase
MKVLITGAAGRIGAVLRGGLRDDVEELRLSDVVEIGDLVAPETFVAADLSDAAAVDRAVAGADAVVHLGAVPDEAPFAEIAGPNLHGPFHVFDACRRLGARRVVFASSGHATGMYPAGAPLDGSQPPRPDGIYGASKVWGEALGRMFAERFGLEVVCLRIGSFLPRPVDRRQLATWLSHGDAVRLVRAALTAPDVRFEIVYGASNNTRRWWPLTGALGYAPQDDAEAYAAEIEAKGDEYELQGGSNTAPGHGGWAS